MTKLLIVDMNNMFWRAYHGLKNQDLRTERGEPTWAIFGTVNTVTSLVREFNPSHLLLAWDSGQSAYRNSIFPDYKGTRTSSGERDPELDFQFKKTRDLFDLLGCFQYSEDKTEADDVIATTVHRYTNETDIVIVSSDHDVKQLINERTVVVKPSLNISRAPEEIFTMKDIVETYGLLPGRLPEIWALHGDTADNIPGAAGVGPKTAYKLIQEWGSLNRVLESGTKKIVGQEEIVRRAFELIELRGDVALCNFQLEGLRFEPESAENVQLVETLKRYEFNSILAKLELDSLWKQVNIKTRSLSE
jgi:5'-3' exonuclease